MSPKGMKGFDFQADEEASQHGLKDEDVKKIMRRSFRVPVGDSDGITARLDEATFKVLNISMGGIGLLLERPEDFYTDDSIKSLTLEMSEGTWKTKVRVAHISPYESGDYICGLEFMEMDSAMEAVLNNFLANAKRKWLETC